MLDNTTFLEALSWRPKQRLLLLCVAVGGVFFFKRFSSAGLRVVFGLLLCMLMTLFC